MRWGIIGPGTIAKRFAANLQRSDHGSLVAIASRNPAKPGLAEDFPGARILNGYQALLDDPEVEAVYIATPHPFHTEWALKGIEAGKHLLVEKPMAVSAHEAEAIIHAARKRGVFLGEAFMNLLHPQTAKVLDLIRARPELAEPLPGAEEGVAERGRQLLAARCERRSPISTDAGSLRAQFASV